MSIARPNRRSRVHFPWHNVRIVFVIALCVCCLLGGCFAACRNVVRHHKERSETSAAMKIWNETKATVEALEKEQRFYEAKVELEKVPEKISFEIVRGNEIRYEFENAQKRISNVIRERERKDFVLFEKRLIPKAERDQMVESRQRTREKAEAKRIAEQKRKNAERKTLARNKMRQRDEIAMTWAYDWDKGVKSSLWPQERSYSVFHEIWAHPAYWLSRIVYGILFVVQFVIMVVVLWFIVEVIAQYVILSFTIAFIGILLSGAR